MTPSPPSSGSSCHSSGVTSRSGRNGEYYFAMRVTTGTVLSGKVILDDQSLTDGTDVLVVTRKREKEVRLSPEELADLEAGIAEADRGETITGNELFARLRRYE